MKYIDLNSHIDLDNEIYRYFITDLIIGEISENSNVLDCGAGDGAVAFPVCVQKKTKVTCLDNNEKRLKNIDSNKDDLNIITVSGDVHQMPFENNSFDVVFSRMLLTHVNWEQVLNEKIRVCKPGGKVLFQHVSLERLNFAKKCALYNGKLESLEKTLSKNKNRVSHEDIKNFCENHEDIILNKIIPLTHFLTNGLIYKTCMNEDEIISLRKNFNKYLAKPEVYEFIRWFERNVAIKLPQEYNEMMFVVIHKQKK